MGIDRGFGGDQNDHMMDDGEHGAVNIRGDEVRAMSPNKIKDENMMNDGDDEDDTGQVDGRGQAIPKRSGNQQVFTVSNSHQR